MGQRNAILQTKRRFKEICYEPNGQALAVVQKIGLISAMKTLVSKERKYPMMETGWIIGMANDYNKFLVNLKHKLILELSRLRHDMRFHHHQLKSRFYHIK